MRIYLNRINVNFTLSQNSQLFCSPFVSIDNILEDLPSPQFRQVQINLHLAQIGKHSKNKTPVLGNTAPVLGVKPKRGY